MSIEGGAYVCYKDDHNQFSTDDPKEWDEHCFNNDHTLTAKVICEDCGESTSKQIPYPKNYEQKAHSGKPIFLFPCPNCTGDSK